jgi:hypothetical protein
MIERIINEKINTTTDPTAATFLEEVKDIHYFEYYGIVTLISQYIYNV